ncbi:MAG: hypothetical protein ABF665_19725, partial [Gluconacetobacter sp.]
RSLIPRPCRTTRVGNDSARVFHAFAHAAITAAASPQSTKFSPDRIENAAVAFTPARRMI